MGTTLSTRVLCTQYLLRVAKGEERVREEIKLVSDTASNVEGMKTTWEG